MGLFRRPRQTAHTGHTAHVGGLARQPGGALLATGSDDGTVRWWDLVASREVHGLRLGPAGTKIHQVAFTPDGRFVAAAQSNGTICILRLLP